MEKTHSPLTGKTPEVDGDDLLTNSGRNWSPDVLLELVKIWRCEFEAHPDWSRVQRMQTVYDVFNQTVDCSQRSRKAVDDKLYSMKQMYHFIAQMKDQFKQGGPDKAPSPSWFELTKEERRVVRTLHRVRIPNISLEVYNVFDSVLSPSAVAARKSAVESNEANTTYGNGSQETSISGDGRAQMVVSSAVATPNDDSQEITQEILDVKRNWSYDVTLQLARVWNSVHKENPALRGAILSLNVYNAFMAAVEGSNRSRKAVDDKMHSMREMYRFMKSYETRRMASGDPKTPWFDLTKPERRAVRAANKIRVPNLAPDVYNELDMLMPRMNQVSPSDSPSEAVQKAVSLVDLEGCQHTAPIPFNNSDVSSASVQSSHSTGGCAQNDSVQAGQTTRECGAKRLVDIAPAAVTNTTPANGNGTLHHQQQQNSRLVPMTTVQNVQSSVQQVSDQGTSKRQRIAQEQMTGSQVSNGLQAVTSAGMVDPQTTREFLVQMLQSMAQDREDRRQQHIEQMSALREIVALLKQRK